MTVASGSAMVLIVDANETVLGQAAQALALEGHRVAPASTIEAAEAIVGNTAVDLVLIDLQMPEISGHDFADYLRDAKHVTAPIILWSNLKPDRLAALIAESGAAGAIRKDLDMTNLCADLSKFLARSADPKKKGTA